MKRRKKSGSRRRLDVPYNADYFAQKHDISLEQARELIRKIGPDRDKLNEAASKLFRNSQAASQHRATALVEVSAH